MTKLPPDFGTKAFKPATDGQEPISPEQIKFNEEDNAARKTEAAKPRPGSSNGR